MAALSFAVVLACDAQTAVNPAGTHVNQAGTVVLCGDCPSTSNAILYSVFKEATPGTNLSGTSPAVLSGPAEGATWSYLQSGNTWEYQAGGGAVATGAVASPYSSLSINAGVSDMTLDVSVQINGANGLLMFRGVDASHYIFITINAQGTASQVVEQTGGGQYLLADSFPLQASSIHAVIQGSSLQLSDAAGNQKSVTLPTDSTYTGTLIGMAEYAGSGMVISSLNITAP